MPESPDEESFDLSNSALKKCINILIKKRKNLELGLDDNLKLENNKFQ